MIVTKWLKIREILRFRAESGDEALLRHFSGLSTVNYQSPKIQNEILKCIGDWVRESILEKVREQPFFCICADEAADCSNKEQMYFVVCFVDEQDSIREEFVDFVLCNEGTTGRAIADKILSKLEEYNLYIKNMKSTKVQNPRRILDYCMHCVESCELCQFACAEIGHASRCSCNAWCCQFSLQRASGIVLGKAECC